MASSILDMTATILHAYDLKHAWLLMGFCLCVNICGQVGTVVNCENVVEFQFILWWSCFYLRVCCLTKFIMKIKIKLVMPCYIKVC